MALPALAGPAATPRSPPVSALRSTAPPGTEAPVFRPAFTPVEPGQIPRDVVASIVQDASGFIWLGTGDGPVRYDGHQMRAIERDDAVASRRNLGWVQAMLASANGAVWLGSETAGLVRHDPRTDAVQTLGCGLRADQPCAIIRALAEDREGSIWVGTQSAGLLKFTPRNGHFTTVALPADPDPEGPGGGPAVRALLLDKAAQLWVGTSAGLFRRGTGQAHFEPMLASVLAGQTVTALAQTSDGQVWVGTQEGQLAALDPASGVGRAWPDLAHRAASVSRGPVSALVEAEPGQLWVGRARGLDLWSTNPAQPLQVIDYDRFEPGGPGGHEVSCMMRSRDGWLWVGTFGVGLQKFNPGKQAIQVRGADRNPGNVLEQPDIRSLLALRDGRVWVGTLAGDVAMLNPQWRLAGKLRQPTGRPETDAASTPGTITAMAQAANAEVWLGADNQLLKLSPDGRVLQHWRHAGGVPNQLVAADDGSLWIASQTGPYRLRPGAAAVQPVAMQDADGHTLAATEFFTAVQGRDGRLWFGGHHGLFVFNPGTDSLLAVRTEPALKLVGGLLEDRNGVLWLDAAVTGLHRVRSWQGSKALVDPVSARHGIINKPFGANLMQDKLGRIWTHMHVYDPRTDRLTPLGPADGVRFGTGRFHVYAQTADGTMLFGGSRGLLVVQPEAFQPTDTAPPLVASGLKVNGLPRPVADRPGQVSLNETERSMSLAFAALEYQRPDALRYRYRLTGLDSQWQETGPSLRQAAYSNLAPGEYELEVQVAAPGSAWSAEPLKVRVTVQPAWWQTATTQAALAGLTLLLFGLLLQWRTLTLRRRQAELELKVAERTQALQAMSAALEEASLSDPLTRLRNRRFLMHHMDAEMALLARRATEARAQGRVPGAEASLVFFMVDIDHFKQINDDHGHAAGDAVLVQVSERLQRVFRAEDYLVRWGGEEFLIVARHTEHAAAAELAERACSAVYEQPFELGESRQLQRSCSVGFACYPLLADDPQALGWTATADLADAALFAAKAAGRNTWVGVQGATGVDALTLRAMVAQPLGQRLRDPRWQILRRAGPC